MMMPGAPGGSAGDARGFGGIGDGEGLGVGAGADGADIAGAANANTASAAIVAAAHRVNRTRNPPLKCVMPFTPATYDRSILSTFPTSVALCDGACYNSRAERAGRSRSKLKSHLRKVRAPSGMGAS